MSTPLLLGLMLSTSLAAAPTRPSEKHTAVKVTTIAEAWRALPETGSGCGADLDFDYGVEGGMRNFFCRALTIFSWKRLLSLAPAFPFLSGPHTNGKLELQSKKQFGHYDPQFVRWAAAAL